MLTMIINEIGEKIILGLEKKIKDLIMEGRSFSDMAACVQEDMNALGISILEEIIAQYNQSIREFEGRKSSWQIVRKDERKLLTSMGEVTVYRDYYRHKKTKGYRYLLDDILGLEPNDRIDSTLKVQLIEKAEKGSYAKAASSNRFAVVSKQTVLHSIREAGILIHKPKEDALRKVPVLYVEADEDHVSYQDGKRGEVKLIYVHEGKGRGKGRGELKGAFYFASSNTTAEEMWLEVADYIYSKYDVDVIERIFVSGDGASWIRSGIEYLPRAVYVLDKFHQNKYIKQAVGPFKEQLFALKTALNTADKKAVFDILKECYEKAETKEHKDRVIRVRRYFSNNWDGISNASRYPDVLGCSAEAHISHVLSERLSSRPMGWSREGADQMGRLRAFVRNGGSISQALRAKQKEQRILDKKVVRRIGLKAVAGLETLNNIPVLSSGKSSGIHTVLKSLQQTRWQIL